MRKNKGTETMSFIGHDIISLRDKDNIRSFSNPRYIQKILTGNEYVLFTQNPKNYFAAYLLWTCKESAYKVALKKGLDKTFVPQYYEVCTVNSFDIPENNLISGTVQFDDDTVYFRSEIYPDYISTISCSDKTMLTEVKSFVSITAVSDHSEKAREQLKETLSFIMKTKKSFIEIYKKNNGIPFLKIANHINMPDISFSHDGNFYSFALLYKN